MTQAPDTDKEFEKATTDQDSYDIGFADGREYAAKESGDLGKKVIGTLDQLQAVIRDKDLELASLKHRLVLSDRLIAMKEEDEKEFESAFDSLKREREKLRSALEKLVPPVASEQTQLSLTKISDMIEALKAGGPTNLRDLAKKVLGE